MNSDVDGKRDAGGVKEFVRAARWKGNKCCAWVRLRPVLQPKQLFVFKWEKVDFRVSRFLWKLQTLVKLLLMSWF